MTTSLADAQDPSSIDPNTTGMPSPVRSGPFDSTARLPGRQGDKVLRDAAALLGSEAAAVVGPSQPPTGPRKHYAGTLKDGKFERTKAARIEDLSEEDRQAVLADVQERRRQKVEELVHRQKM